MTTKAPYDVFLIVNGKQLKTNKQQKQHSLYTSTIVSGYKKEYVKYISPRKQHVFTESLHAVTRSLHASPPSSIRQSSFNCK